MCELNIFNKFDYWLNLQNWKFIFKKFRLIVFGDYMYILIYTLGLRNINFRTGEISRTDLAGKNIFFEPSLLV